MTRFILALLTLAATLFHAALPAQDNLPNALLWRIESPELEEPSWLFGTIHMIAEKDYYLAPEVEDALNQAKVVAFEIDLTEMNDLSKMMGLISGAFMNGGTTLSDLLDEEEYALVEEHFKQIGLPLMLLERIKPMFLSAMASDNFGQGGSLENSGVESYEMNLMALAEQGEKPIAGLETMAYQMSMFDSIPYEAQAQMLVEAIEAESGESDELDELVKLYKKQDLNGMEVSFKSQEGGLGGYEELLLNQRNRNWIPVMAEMMAEGPTFFAVGAGHLVGSQGVIRLLEAEGYELKPIAFSWPDE